MPLAPPRPAAAPAPSVLAPHHRAATVGMVALVSLTAFEALAVATAMPTVAGELDGLRLYAAAFGALLAASVPGMVLAGHACDRDGPARPLWAGLAAFVAGLLLAGLATDMRQLVAGRVLQGLGAGATSVALYVLVGRLYPPTLQPRMFAAFSAGWVLPSLVGPALAGVVVQHAGWRWIFLGVAVLAVPAAILLARPLRRLPAPPRAAGTKPRWPWALLAALGILALHAGAQLAGAAAAGVLLAGLLATLAGSGRLLPPGTWRAAPGLPSLVLLRGLAPAAFFGCEAFVPLLLARERGLSPSLAGLALGAGAFSWFCGSWYQGHYAARTPRIVLIQRGAAALALGIAAVAATLQPTVPLAVAVGGWVLAGLGMGLAYPSMAVLALQLSAPGSEGRNSAALQLGEAITVAIMLAVAGALFARLFGPHPLLAYLAAFAPALLLALLVGPLARRVAPAQRSGNQASSTNTAGTSHG